MSRSVLAIQQFLQQHQATALARINRIRGSTPREAGAWMLVSLTDCYGTIGGGQLEYQAIQATRELLDQGKLSITLDIPLGPEIGQCCGGHVTVSIKALTPEDHTELINQEILEQTHIPNVYVFGAGHVGRALITALHPLPVHPILIDSRWEELEQTSNPVEHYLTPLPETIVREAKPNSAFVILTHSHSLDFLIAQEALQRNDARYVGMIGSRTKRAQFERWCQKRVETPIDTRPLICPIGALGSPDKRPEVIAALTAAEIMVYLTKFKTN